MSCTTAFLDRDGVINQDSPDYIKCWAEFHFIPGSLDAVARLTRSGCSVIIITNQSTINRRMITLNALKQMHRKLSQAKKETGQRPDPVAADLDRAAQWILDRPGPRP